MKIGFIGTGSMGRTLVEAFIHAQTFLPSEIVISNRTQKTADQLAAAYPGIQVAHNNLELVQQVSCFFICVKPGEFRQVFEDILPGIKADQLAISITSPVMLEDLEKWLPCKVAKIIPSITNQVLCGSSLYIPGSRITPKEEQWLHQLLSTISNPLKVDERHTRISSDLASCAPAFLANILEQMVEAAVKKTGIPPETAAPLVAQMALGVGKLLTEGGFSLHSLQQRVSVPGGITAEGLELLEQELSPAFDKLFHITHAKYEEDVEKVKRSLQYRSI
ncbi:late competence protein ComER [Paenactinomyces guangxiensis]|uniref:Pyrroline-5-carboxylate reductase n=1 Tax=Paenactinomyces guangxiensis TaxID=1490290 RepID=A0A7W2A677_9BACL|nr:late competence protein ComER [Paenactinomyces guangxiensis]MBA4493081.1 late competence protein ComER [Paenactinomyces guangxiensis]MBH8590069.1 late competence protein ComER [Paenactinomyces guangxiensis]